MNKQYIFIGMLSAALFAGIAGCEREGTMERAGEEVDEAVDTIKEGEESTGNQVDDAVDEMREGVNDATDEVRDE